MVGIPAYASPKYNAQMNSYFASAFGTPQFGGENFYGFGTMESYSFTPESYLNTFASEIAAKPSV
jgi:hypothetical protein